MDIGTEDQKIYLSPNMTYMQVGQGVSVEGINNVKCETLSTDPNQPNHFLRCSNEQCMSVDFIQVCESGRCDRVHINGEEMLFVCFDESSSKTRSFKSQGKVWQCS